MNDETPKDFNPQLAQLSNFLTYRIARVHQKLNVQATRILHDSVGLTLSQWRVIAFVGGAGEVIASELVKYTAMDKGLVSRNVKSLIESGLVSSSNHANDRWQLVYALIGALTGVCGGISGYCPYYLSWRQS